MFNIKNKYLNFDVKIIDKIYNQVFTFSLTTMIEMFESSSCTSFCSGSNSTPVVESPT